MDKKKTVGANIARLRKERGIRQGAMSGELGIAVSTLSQYETGRRSPDEAMLGRIAGFLGVDMMELFEGGQSVPLPEGKAQVPSGEQLAAYSKELERVKKLVGEGGHFEFIVLVKNHEELLAGMAEARARLARAEAQLAFATEVFAEAKRKSDMAG